MGKTSFQNINELLSQLSENIEKLQKGNLEIAEIETLVEQSKDLYERLVILRYKAYEKYGEPSSPVADPEQEEQVDQEESTNEVAQEDAPVKEEIKKEPQVMEETLFDFSGITEVEENEPEEIPETEAIVEEEDSEEVVEEEELVVEEDEEETEVEAEIISEENPIASETETNESEKSLGEELTGSEESSLNDALKNDELSLRKKLQNSPIEDIKSEITIAKRFEYITNMFDGKKDSYEEAINILNACANAEEARNKLNHYSTEYNWDLEDKSIIKFIELVERRYM